MRNLDHVAIAAALRNTRPLGTEGMFWGSAEEAERDKAKADAERTQWEDDVRAVADALFGDHWSGNRDAFLLECGVGG